MVFITLRWLGRALALLGTSPTESAIANLTIDRKVIFYREQR